VIILAHSLGMDVVAEGVETAAELAILRKHHCDKMQGFYFSRPVPVKDFETLLRSGKTL
jgi:EAL domain-containing protein (putative c-di-GMP-specific phosphodiesterase class I)